MCLRPHRVPLRLASADWLVFGGYSGYPHARYERGPGRMIFRLSVGFLVAVLALLAMSLYFSEYYLGEESDQQGIAEVICAKHRNGPTGMVKLSFLRRYAKFADLAAA